MLTLVENAEAASDGSLTEIFCNSVTSPTEVQAAVAHDTRYTPFVLVATKAVRHGSVRTAPEFLTELNLTSLPFVQASSVQENQQRLPVSSAYERIGRRFVEEARKASVMRLLVVLNGRSFVETDACVQ